MNRLPSEVSVSFGKDGKLLLGKISLSKDEDPIFIQAKNPTEFTKLLNEAVYVSYDVKSEYIDFFHSKGDRYKPSAEAQEALEQLYGRGSKGKSLDFSRVFDFKGVNEKRKVALA